MQLKQLPNDILLFTQEFCKIKNSSLVKFSADPLGREAQFGNPWFNKFVVVDISLSSLGDAGARGMGDATSYL
jgi:hypothetical protein